MDTVMEQAISAAVILKNNWEALGGMAGFLALFAVVTQYLKIKLNLDVDRMFKVFKGVKISNKGLVNILLLVMTLAATALETATQIFDIFPNALVAYPAIGFGIVQAHRIIVSPLFSQTKDKLEAKRQQERDAQSFRDIVAAQKQAAMPTAPTQPSAAPTVGYNPAADIDVMPNLNNR